MDLCYRAPDLSAKAGQWTGYGANIRASVKPLFASAGLPNIGSSYIRTSSAHWSMHGSQQNNCYHRKYRGSCYKLDCETYYPASYPTLPYFRVPYTESGSERILEGNYVFPMSSTYDTLLTQVGKSGSKEYSTSLIIWTICVPIRHPSISDSFYALGYMLDVTITDLETGITWFNARQPGPIDQTSTYQVYRFGEYSTPQSVGSCSVRAIVDPYKQSVTVLSATSPKRFYNRPTYRVRDCVTSVGLELPPIDDETIFSPVSRFMIEWDEEGALTAGLSQVNFFGSNGMAFARDVGSLPTTIQSDLSQLKSLTSADPSGKLRIAASAFLSVHYGYKLLAADGIELANVLADYDRTHTLHIGQTMLSKAGLTRVGSRCLLSHSGHLNVYYDPFGQLTSDIYAFAEAVDLVPDFSNVWDMIPFSFVVDWFTNVGDLASGIDDYFTLTQQHKVLGSIVSHKLSYINQPQGFFGSIIYDIYTRSCRRGWFPNPRFSFQLKNPVTNLYHWLEGSALVVSTRC